jgi:hypothetical protein
MATESHKMFGCPVCGYRVEESDPACPRCNHTFDIGTKFECPFCGELVDLKVKVCPACHVDYAEFREKTKRRGGDSDIDELLNEIIKMESMQVKQEPKKFSCPDCTWRLDGSEGKCPKCGRDLSDEFAFQCPICGSSTSSDAASCPECWAKFEAEGTPASSPSDQPTINELEDFAATVKTSPPTIGQEQELPFAPSVEEQPIIEPVSMEPTAPEVNEPEKESETSSDQTAEAPPVKPAAPKTRKRKLKAKPRARP